ncbi:MAG: tetratricopeptide repeat protein, partial [Planctomycetes bacterium]|nr:tetratricopeptide repeat protein [Planctomycetota bacterium]
ARTPLPAPLRTPAPAPAPTPPATPAPPLPAHRGFAASVATAPQFALVAGEAGVGKTRLLTEFKIHCQVRGIKVFRGDCYEETARAYGPLLQVFRAVGRAFSPDAEGIRRKLPELGRVLGYLTFSRAVAPGSPSGLFEQRAAILDGIARLLTRVAGEMPFVIWLENLQWADVETVEALRHLLRLAAPSTEDGEPDSPRLAAGDAPLPVLLAATVREAEATGRPAEGLLRELQAHAVRREAGDALPVLWVQLDGLARPAVTDLVASMLGLDEVPEELVARVHAASGGNPMKVETFMRILLAEQILRHTAGSWSVDLEALARLPAVEDLSRLLDFDLEGLPKTAREILSCLAALDRPEPLPVLRAAVKGADDAFYSALFELVSRRLVSDDLVENEVRYQLGVVPRRPLLAGLGARGARQALHRRIADALATAHAEAPEEHAAEIARHLRLAGNDATQRRKLVKVAQMAGREARRVLALGAAREHFGVALAAARGLRLGARALADLRLALGEVCHELGDLPGALAAYRAALRGVGRERERAEIALLLGKSLERGGDYPGALYQVEKARAGFERDGDAEGTARACLEIAWLRGYRLCRFEEGSEFCARALRLLEGKKAVETQIRAFTVLGAVHQTAGQWEESLRCHQRALELRRRSEDRFELPSALNNVGLTYFLKGDALGARDYAREGVERVVGSERPGLHGTLLSTLANCHFALGAWSEARADWARAREIAERIGDRRRIAVSCAYLGALAHAQGDASSAIDLLMRAILILRDLGLALEQREVYLKLAGVNRDLGAFEAAADDVRAAGAQAASNRFLDALTDRCCARLAHLRGDLSAADGGYRKVLRAFTRMGLAREKSEALADLAEVQLEQGARRKAQLTAGRAERLAESLSFQEGRVRAVFARANAEALLALERRDTQVRGDTEESEESESERRVRAALAVAEGMGARWLVWQGRWAHARCAAARGMAAAAGPRYRAAESALAEIATRVPEHLRDGLAAIPRIREFTREAARYR